MSSGWPGKPRRIGLLRAGIHGLHRFLLACCATLALSPEIAAESASKAETSAETPVVVVVYDPRTSNAAAAATAIQSHLSGVRVTVQVYTLVASGGLREWLERTSRRTTSTRLLGTLSVIATETGNTLVFFEDPDGSAILLRRIRPKDSSDRVGLEEAGIVARSLVEALLERRRLELANSEAGTTSDLADAEKSARSAEAEVPSRDSSGPESSSESALEEDPFAEPPTFESVEPTEIPNAPTRPFEGHRWSLVLGYVGTSFASDTDFQSGAGVGLQMAMDPKLALRLSYALFPELTVSRKGTSVAIRRHPSTLTVSYVPLFPFSPVFEGITFADYVERSTLDAESGFRSTADQKRLLWGFGARAGAQWSTAGGGLHMRVTGGFDIPTGRVTYVVGGIQPQTFLSSRSVRPQIEGTVLVDLW